MKNTRNIFVSAWFVLMASVALADDLPKGFVYVEKEMPDVAIELRYFGKDNFVGARVDGYLKAKCILSKPATEALKKVQAELATFGLGLKVYDAYRPQRAVDHFVRWAKDLQDKKTKKKYYPNVLKEKLFEEGYIAEKSSHTRGSTVDVTIINLKTKKELDMGSTFDFFGTISWPSDPRPNESQRAHRMLLQSLMLKHGFSGYQQEWWHFTLKDEPYPETYFDFPVQ